MSDSSNQRKDFIVVFPSKELLRMAIRGGGLVLPSSKCHAVVKEVLGDPRDVETLEVLWVLLHDVPDPLRDEKSLPGSTLELGCPLEVDPAGLEDERLPIQMKFGCRKHVHLKSHITLFVNLQGYLVRVERMSE